MIMTVAELRKYITTDEDDSMLEAKLQALELAIRAYTNNNFQDRPFRAVAVSLPEHELLCNGRIAFRAGDTLQISESDLMQGELVTVESVDENKVIVKENLFDESGVLLTKVKYPQDIKMGIVNLLKWEMNNRDKVGIASESISRHSVTYFDMTGDNSTMGFPKALMGFLKPYMKARFGRGVK